MTHSALLAIAFCLLGGSAPGGEKWPVPRGPSREPSPYRHNPAVLKKLPPEFLDDFAACILYYGATHLLEADGSVESITHEVTRLNGRKGVERYGEYRGISFDPGYQKLTLHTARVIKADGQVVAVQPKHLQLRDQGTDYQVYDTDKQLVISFPNLQVGDTIEVKWTVRGKHPEFAGHFFNRYSFDDDRYPIALEELRIRHPRGKPFTHATVNGKLTPAVRSGGKNTRYTWRIVNRPPLPQDGDLPSRETLRLQVMSSTFASWAEVGRWKHRLRASCWECTPAIKKTVLEVTAGCKTPQEKARALATWVRRNIRYVSFASAGHSYTPHQPEQVLGNRFGDCKDQAQLLAVMLREAGLDVALVTLGVQDDGQVLPGVPSPWGTHGILLVRIAGKDHWIDTTATQNAWDFLPPGARDRVCYATTGEAIKLMRTPPLTCDLNRQEQTTRVWVRPDGSTWSRRSATYHGQAAVNRRDAWLEVPQGDRRRQMTAALQDANSRTRLLGLSVDEASLLDFERPVRGSVEFEIPAQFSGDPDREGSFSDSPVWNRLLAYTLDHDRKVPLDLGQPFESIHRYEITVAPAYRLDGTPSGQEVRSKWGTFKVRVRSDEKNPRRLDLTLHLRLERTRIDPADFDAYRTFHEEVSKHWRVWVNVTPTRDPADVPLLRAWLFFAPADRVTASVLARLHLDNDQPEQARRVLQLARAFHPREPQLWELSVKAAANPEQEEATYRDMVSRFPAESKYALALGEVCVRRGDAAGARTVLTPLAEKGPANVRGAAHYQLARAALLAKQPAVALKHLQQARDLGTDSVNTITAWGLQGEVHERLGQIEEAIRAYRRALKLDPGSTGPRAALIRLALAAGGKDEVLDDLRQYTLAVGNDPAGLVQAAGWHLELGRLDDALDLAARAQKQRFDAQAQRVLGLVHLRLGNFQQAVGHLEKADRDGAVFPGLIRAYLALGRVQEAIDSAEAAGSVASPPEALARVREEVLALAERRKGLLRELKLAPAKAYPWAVAVDAFLAADHAHRAGVAPKRVEALLAGAFGAGVDFGPAYALRGELALARGQLGKALADSERALTLSPREARGYYVRGRVRLERVDRDALADLTRAAELSRRGDGVILHWLAAAQFQSGLRAQALATQREAVQLRPHDPELAEQLSTFRKAALD
ncbi:MAG: tetratricopeptide repeat protein [Gemmataceae bacterium]|nr:tetratricopeptide repeat protein [Gemmataceae bacterium]